MILFFPSFLLTNSDDNTNTGPESNTTTTTIALDNIQFDIFSAVVFIVAGPAIGFTLSEAVIFFSFLIFSKISMIFYVHILVWEQYCKDSARSELDTIDARIIFNSSTGVGLGIIALLLLSTYQLEIENFQPLIPPTPDQIWIRIVISVPILWQAQY